MNKGQIEAVVLDRLRRFDILAYRILKEDGIMKKTGIWENEIEKAVRYELKTAYNLLPPIKISHYTESDEIIACITVNGVTKEL